MSRQYVNGRKRVELPLALQNELGRRNEPADDSEQRPRAVSAISARKAQRQALRKSKKGGIAHTQQRMNRHDERVRGSSHDYKQQPQSNQLPKQKAQPPTTSRPRPLQSSSKKPVIRHESPRPDDSRSTRFSSPALVLDASSKTYKERSAQDDAEIKSLEKRLGMKKRKSKGTGDDMLDYLLEGLSEDNTSQQKKQSKEWLSNKRRKVVHQSDSDEDESVGHDEIDMANESDDMLEGTSSLTSDLGSEAGSNAEFRKVHWSDNGGHNEDHDMHDDNLAGFDPNEDFESSPERPSKIRENPYVAPTALGASIAKYVPPSLRDKSLNKDQVFTRLKKQIQGCLNKLSEANLISILGEIEDLYRNNARQDVTSMLIDLLLSAFCNPSALQNTFIILHAAFVTAVYKIMGTDFGAEILVHLVERIDGQYRDGGTAKQTLNLISLLSNLFTFGLTGSNIVYDYIRLLLSDFNESNAELLLRIVRDCGPQLRSDDPSALKSIVQTVQSVSTDIAKKGEQLNIRTRVMIDTITDLKNNKMKNATNAAGVTGEHLTRMRKALGSLNNRNLKATEPLRITKQDIESSDKKGKWWLVGASWKGHQKAHQDLDNDQLEESLDTFGGTDEQEPDFLALAKQFRMNTDVRRSIFVAIMSAGDVKDAQLRLLKLRLSSKQEQEIAKVLLRCTRAEQIYNPYYALLAKRLCKENKKIRVGLQFGLWSFFNAMGERADDEDDDEEDGSQDIGLNEIVNVAKMFAYLIFHNHLDLGTLKTLNIGFLKENANTFLEILLISIMTQPTANEENLLKIFGRCADTPQIVKSLQYFMRKNLRRTDLVPKADKKKFKQGCKIADAAFDMINLVERNAN